MANHTDLEKETMRENKEAYGAALKSFDQSVEGLKGSVKDTADAANVLGGSIGGLISQGKTKASANAAAYPTTSLIKKAAKNIFEFPVFVSSSVPMDFATATNSLLEQVYASFVQMAISQTPVVSAADMKSGNPFRSMKSDVSKYLEYTDMFYAHDACHNVLSSDDMVCEFDMINVDDKMTKIINEYLDHEPLSEFNHFFQEEDSWLDNYKKNAKKDKDEAGRKAATRAQNKQHDFEDSRLQDIRDDLKKREEEREELKDDIQDMKDNKDNYIGDDNETYYKNLHHKEDRLDTLNSEIDTLRKNLQSARYSFAKEVRDQDKDDRDTTLAADQHKKAQRDEDVEKRNKEKHPLEVAKLKTDLKAKAPQFIDETKIQKLNSMKPLMMTVGLRVMDNNNSISEVVDYVVGVKTHCRVVPADVLPDFAEYPSKTMNFMARKAKWRSGEIKFIDYMFSRKEKKQAAYDSRDPKRKWYHRLYNLAHAKGSSRLAKQITGSKSSEGLIPNATVILTKADVDMIESVNKIDLLKGSTAAKICKELFLIGIVVIDTDAQSIKMLLPDINNDYEVHSLASVNKQLATLDTSNSVSREVSRMMRDR